MSVFVAIVSWLSLTLCTIVLQRLFGVEVKGGIFLCILFSVAAYKIMRSVAGFSSVFWKTKKIDSRQMEHSKEIEQEVVIGKDLLNNGDIKFIHFGRLEEERELSLPSKQECVFSDSRLKDQKQSRLPINKWIVVLFSLVLIFIAALGSGLIVENHMENKAEDVIYRYEDQLRKYKNQLREQDDLANRVYSLLQKKYKYIDAEYFEKQKRENEIKDYLALDALTRDWEKFPEARQRAIEAYGEAFAFQFEKYEYMRDRLAGEKVLETLYPNDGSKDFDALRKYNRDHGTQLITPGVWGHFLSNREQLHYRYQ